MIARAPVAVGLAFLTLTGAAWADAGIFVVDPASMPFDLGPGAPQNQASRRSNLPSAPGNSSAMPGNSSRTRANAPDNPLNAPDGGRAIVLEGLVVGYYTQNSGTLNLFSPAGTRLAYRPKGTKSLFTAQGAWCGTVAATSGGGFAFGMTESCARRFLP
ncbi:MAG: hypothetical protein DI498_10185 [Paracoccus denitrificans]|nr:MAG: hypothetical protein DI498_10185 [Paracoccus denitrificans]PZO83849.1 MAG: hypothetical protein DI633_10185 [Paracoccus denitrificans]